MEAEQGAGIKEGGGCEAPSPHGSMHIYYIFDVDVQHLHISDRVIVAEVNCPLVELSGAAPARRLASTARRQQAKLPEVRGEGRVSIPYMHDAPLSPAPLLPNGIPIVNCSFLEPSRCPLVVQWNPVAASREHAAELILARGPTRLGADRVRHDGPRVVDRHALAVK